MASTFEPVRTLDYKWAFSTKQQADIDTVLADADLNKVVPALGFAPASLSREFRDDMDLAGKGHEYPTPGNDREVTRDAQIARSLYGSSLTIGWAAAFCMGKVTTVQPNPGGNPTAYRHTIIPSDPAVTGKHAPVTTIYEEIAAVAGFQRKFRGMAVNDFSISGARGDILNLQVNLAGAGESVADPVSVAAITAVDYLDMQNLVFKIGDLGSAVDLSDRLLEWSMSFSQNLDLPNGYYPGSGLYRGRLWFGFRRVSARFRVWVDAASSDMRDLWTNRTKREVSFKSTGSVIGSGPEAHDAEVLFPSVRLTEVPVGESDGKAVYDIVISERQAYKDSAASVQEICQITVTNTESSYLATP